MDENTREEHMIYDAEHRRVMRANVVEDLVTLASPDEQLKFQRDMPFVSISVELVCNTKSGFGLHEARA